MAGDYIMTSRADIPSGDYVSAGLSVVIPDACFPNMVVGDKARHPWPYLRREIPHNWYCDRRAPRVGFLNRDEATLLYNLALPFRGKPGLEIGSWMGWSTCHLALAGLMLDAIDPAVANSANGVSVRESLAAAGVLDQVRLYATASPEGVRTIAELTDTRWSFFFIDGDHDAPAPERDAHECLRYAADDAMIVFHDLASPDVEGGLDVLRREGWSVLVYQTMQIMGVAWRGQVRPVAHTPDPSVVWSLPLHLAKYRVSGASRDEELGRLSLRLATSEREIDRLQGELTSLEFERGHLRADVTKRDAELASLRAEAALSRQGTERLESELAQLRAEAALSRQGTERLESELAQLRAEAALSRRESERLEHVARSRGEDLGRLQTELRVRDEEIHRLASDAVRRSGQIERLSAEAERLEASSRRLCQSRSWKVTRPLRALTRGGRRLRSMPRRLVNEIARQPLMTAGGVSPRVTRLLTRVLRLLAPESFQRSEAIALISHSGLFDPAYYVAQNPDVARGGKDPVAHYVRYGAAEGRDPHPLFDTSFYREANPDVAQAGLNPLVHYLQYGAAEGRDPHPLFDTSFYREANPDVVQVELNPLAHYLQYGAVEGRDPHPLFDTSFYREANPDVVQAEFNPLAHYLQYGAVEGRDPHPLFDTSFYVEQKPHVATLDVNPLVHFLREGPTATFDPFSSPPPLPETGVCIVTPDIVGPVKNGGIGTACYHFTRVLAGAGHDVTVFYTGAELSDCQKAHWRNVFARVRIRFVALSDAPPTTRLVYGSTWFFDRSWRVFEYLRRRPFSVIHFQDWHGNGFWSIKAKKVGLAFDQTVLTVMTHSCTKWINEGMQQFGSDPFETAKLVWAETYCIEQCDMLLSPSRYMLDWVAANHIRAPQRIVLTPYAVEDSQVEEAQPIGDVDNEHLIFFGRLETRKGVHILAEAFRQLRHQGEALPRLVSFVGKHDSVMGRPSADYLSELQGELRPMELRIISNLDYAGALDYIKRTRGLVVIPSILDNLPLAVIECIQNRIPFIAAMIGGIPELVDPRVSFTPTPSALATLLGARHTIDHARMDHRYSPSLARTRWRELHTELVSPNGQGEGSAPREPQPSESKRVSVCIPFFNHHRYLETLVAAFARQTYPDLEVVFVNDGSSQEASRAFDRMATRSRDRRFRFLTTENQGPGAARNFAAAQASGDLLLFFDADNLPKEDDFVWVLARALQHSEADCVTCPYDIVDSANIFPAANDVVATYRPYGPCLEAAFVENTLGDVTMLIARSVFEGLGGFQAPRASSREDHQFLLNLCFKGHTLETVPDATFYYRQSPNGRFLQSSEFLNYQSLFEQVYSASTGDLARIVGQVAGPMLLARMGCPAVAR